MVEALHKLGPRAVYELLCELDRHHVIESFDQRLERFAALDPQALAARLASRRRRCYVYENPPPEPGFHLLLVDDDGGLILVEQVIDWEAAVWLATLVNQALAAERQKAKRGAQI